MKIYTNEGNPLSLKLLLLAKFAKRDVVLEKVSLNEPSGEHFLILPTAELEGGLKLFSTDAVAKYLFPNEDTRRDEWLEWSATQLAPALAQHWSLGANRNDPDVLLVIKGLLKKLDDHLKNVLYLIGDKISAADLAIWSLLAPENTLKIAQNLDNLHAWFKRVHGLPEVQAVLAEHSLKSLVFSSCQNSNRYRGLQHITLPCSTTSTSASKPLIDNVSTTFETITDDEMEMARNAFVHVEIPERKEVRTVLPVAGERNILVTSALPYVNNVPHLGNIIGCVLSADIYARYARSVGYNTLFISGTDEYGTATENKALAENVTPREICDKYFELHNSIYRWFGIGFDYFGRTTFHEQTEIVQEAFKHVYDAGYILKDSVEQLLCQKCNRFLADRFVEGTCPHSGCGYEDARGDQCDKCGRLVNATELIKPRCKMCNTAPVIRSSEQLFLDLPKIEERLRVWVEKSESGWTNNARVITRAWLREGLKPRCITRDLKWGIPVPHTGFENKVFYVWFDAPFGYPSITKRYTKDYLKWWQPSPDVKVELFQFMAKDNVPFHSVMWPASLLAMNRGHTLVSHIMATEYLNYEDGKFSKSRGVGVFGNDAQDTGIPADVWRFYLASARPEGQDSCFSWNDLAARNNSELLNNLGNFVNRALVFCEKNYDGVIPAMILTNDEMILLALVNRELRGFINSLEKAKFRDGIRHLLSISRHGNGYMQGQQPWVLLKGTNEEKTRAATIIGICCNIACLLANLLFPFMPTTARTMFSQLNTKQTMLNPEKPFMTILLKAGHKIGKPSPLFTKLEQSYIDELKKKYAGSQVSSENCQSSVANDRTQTIAQLEEAIKNQGEKVRQLKATVKDKTVWQPEVDILLNLKKKLTEAQKMSQTNASEKNEGIEMVQNGIESVEKLEEAIQRQGAKVRELKAKTKDKAVWQPEVNILLELKKKLAWEQNKVKSVDSIKVQALEAQIAKQAEQVRALKASSEPSVWKPEVDILLALKKQLANLQVSQFK